jgi:hypothetical protein
VVFPLRTLSVVHWWGFYRRRFGRRAQTEAIVLLLEVVDELVGDINLDDRPMRVLTESIAGGFVQPAVESAIEAAQPP